MIYDYIRNNLEISFLEQSKIKEISKSFNIYKDFDFDKQKDIDILCQLLTFEESVKISKNKFIINSLDNDDEEKEILANQIKNVFLFLFNIRENHKNIIIVPNIQQKTISLIDKYNIPKSLIFYNESSSYKDLCEKFNVHYDEDVREAIQTLSGDVKITFICPKYYFNNIFSYEVAIYEEGK